MLKINTQEVLEFALPQSYSEFFYSYWTGLSRNGSAKAWLWVDGAPYSSELFEIVIDVSSLRSRDCVTILHGKAFSKDCRELRRCAYCTKTPTLEAVDNTKYFLLFSRKLEKILFVEIQTI
ncbi:C-type lectin domain family 1 member A [Manis javanica]|nr:C-type lectin domain family 1 member A [Manis javanica]